MTTQKTRPPLMYDRRGYRLTLGGQQPLWEANFFDCDDTAQCFRLFYFPDDTQVSVVPSVSRCGRAP
jgi:hypothetical protein